MKRLLILIIVLGVAGLPALAQRTIYVSPDVPTDDPGGSGTVFQPSHAIEYKAGSYTPGPVLTLPPGTALDALHKLDKRGHWLMSVETTTELPPGGGVFFDPEDVFDYDGANYTMRYDGTAAGVPPGVNVDAVFLERHDLGDLILSFDVPVDLLTSGGSFLTFEPADLVRYSGGFYTKFFNAAASGSGIATSDNVTGADESGGFDLLAADIPSDMLPSIGPGTYVPGQIAGWDPGPANYFLYDALGGWPLSSEVDGFSCQANPGSVYDRGVYNFPITLSRSTTAGNIVISWSSGCSWGAEDYGIYEGSLASVRTGTYDHVKKFPVCTDVGGDLTEDFTPQAVSSYYLVVPHDWVDEGSFGQDFDPSRVPARLPRPQATNLGNRCEPTQVLSPCPP